MPFDITPDVHLRRDSEGRVRQLQHIAKPYTPQAVALAAAAPSTPRALAEEYLRDIGPILDLAPPVTSNFAAEMAAHPTPDANQLRFKEEKSNENSTTVSYAQTVLGLPIWNAGVSVQMQTQPLQVTGAHNALHYGVEQLATPPVNARYLPNRIDPDALRALLQLAPTIPAPVVNSTRLLIYRYEPAQRLDPQIDAHAGSGGFQPPDFPSLPLPAVPGDIVPDHHYVVSEVLFTLSLPKWGELHWRAFLEPEKGAVLYLRALVACASGHVFQADPITQTGTLTLTAASPTATLNPLRRTFTLLGLVPPPVAVPTQGLNGQWIQLKDIDPPHTAMPTTTAPFDFDYSCDSTDFAAVSAYYHCDWVYRFIAGLGFNLNSYFSGTSFPVPVDPHALSDAVNAQARGNTMGNGMGAFVFGRVENGQTMGIAADVRVVIHEFGHALLWDHVSSPNFGFAHSAGDSLGAILHDPASLLTGLHRFETFPFMNASSGLSRRHDRDVAAGWAWGGSMDDTQYGSEQVLSTLHFRIYRAAGGDSTDIAVKRQISRYIAFLIVKAIGTLTFTSTDPDTFAQALIGADSTTITFEGLSGGTLAKVIRWSFEQQGLYQPPGAPSPVTSPGAPPDIDVFVDDGRGGSYMPFQDPFDVAQDIWNRNVADGGMTHETPILNVPNFVYVKVQNRGTKSATSVTARAFQSKVANATTFPSHWSPMTTQVLPVAGGIAPGATVVVGPFQWTPSFDNQSGLISVDADGDRSNLTLIKGAVLNAQLVRLDNNLAQRRF
jgi:zinc metalloprotease ZmpB